MPSLKQKNSNVPISSSRSHTTINPVTHTQFEFGLLEKRTATTTTKNNKHRFGTTSQQQPTVGVYASYKKATQVFRDGLAKLLPKGFRLTSIDDYKRGADTVVKQSIERIARRYHHHSRRALGGHKQGHGWGDCNKKNRLSQEVATVDQSVLDNLNSSIRYRQEQARKHGDGDEGHAYIIKVLGYCRDALIFSNDLGRFIEQEVDTKAAVLGPNSNNNPVLGSRFLALGVDEPVALEDVWHMYEDKNNTNTNSSRLAPPSKPQPPPPCSSPSKGEDLVQTDDRFQCIAFLSTMDRLMGMIREHYDEVKRVCIEDNGDDQLLLYSAMEAAIVTNQCIECVKSTWAELTLGHSHIRSFYDLLAIVFVIPDLSAKKHDNVMTFENDRHPHLLAHLVGDLVEACFAVDGLDTSKAIKAYGLKLGLPDGGWEKESLLEDANVLAQDICSIVMESESCKIRRFFLKGYKYIGDRRCILNTQKVVQQVLNYVYTETGQTSTKGLRDALIKAGNNTFAFDWHEDKNPARAIRRDLDRFLASQALPDLIAACYDFPEYFQQNPGVSKFVPILHSLERCVSNQLGGPVPIVVTFAIHAMLISAMALQGNGHVERLGAKAESAFADHFETLKQSAKAFSNGDNKKPGQIFSLFQYVGASPERQQDAAAPSALDAYWNPLMAGSLCVYAVYIGLACGNRYLREDLRDVMHLYNAFRCRGLVEKIELLELLDSVFATTPAIWIAGKSMQQGDFAKNYLLGIGASIRDVSFIVDCLKTDHGIRTNQYRYSNDRNKSCVFSQTLVQILYPQDYSYGCAAFFQQDYSGLDECTDEEVSNRQCFWADDSTQYELFIKRTCRAVRKDAGLFGGSFLNIVAIGSFLKEFGALVNEEFGCGDDCLKLTLDVLGELDFAHESKLKNGLASRVSKLMTTHFGEVPRSSYTFSSGL